MSHHQSRADRSDSQQRRGARSGGGAAHQRASAGKSGGGGPGPSAGATSFTSPAAQPAPVPSFKRSGGINGQTRGHLSTNAEVSETQRTQQSAPSQQHSMQAGYGQPGIKSSNGTLPRSSRPGTPSSSSISIEPAPVITKADVPWNASVQPQLSFQFGSIGASIGPGPGPYVQIPARTSSAPPNLDEQKQDLLRYEAISAQPVKVSIPSGGQQQGPRSQLQQSGGQQPHYPSFRPQSQHSAAGVPQPSYRQQGQQQLVPVHVTQRGSHVQASSVGNTQGQLQMQAHVIPSQPQHQSMTHIPYQHGLPQQMQHNGSQVMSYSPSMGGPPHMGTTLTSVPGPIQAAHMSQMSHQLTGGLGSGISGPPYGVVPAVPSSIIPPPRTSSAVKITHPETHEELKFDYKSTKRDMLYDGISVTAAAPQSSMVGNGPLQTRPPLGYGSGGHLSANQNVYTAQQNGPYASIQHHYQPPPSLGMVGKNATGPEAPSTGKMTLASSANTVTSKESTPGISIPSVPGSSNSRAQIVASVASEKQEQSPAISALETNDQTLESTFDVNDKSVKVWPAESVTVAAKDVVLPGKEVKEEGSDLIPLKESPRADSAVEVRQNNKKKKKKDGLSRVSSGDATKVTRGMETKKQSDSKILEPQKAKPVISKGVKEIGPTVASVTAGTMPEAVDVRLTARLAESCDAELATRNHSAVSDVSLNSEIDNETAKEVGTLEQELPASVPCLDVKSSANTVDKAVSADLELGSGEHTEKQSDIVPVQVDSQTLAIIPEADVINLSSKVSQATQSVESSSVLESQATQSVESSSVLESQAIHVEPREEVVIEPTCKATEVEIHSLKDTKVNQDDSIDAAVNCEPESQSASEIYEDNGGLQAQIESVELHLNEQASLVSPKEVPEEAIVSAAPDVKQGSKKKKMKDILAKADAAGSGDLYNAYKAPEQRKVDEAVYAKDGGAKSSSSDSVKQGATADESAVPREVDDWEDAVELPSPKRTDSESGDRDKTGERRALEAKGGAETYTRDFLLTFKDQNLDLPLDFEVRPDIAELLSRYVDQDMLPGKLDRQLSGGPRRSNSSSTFEDERWARGSQVPHSPIRPDGYIDSGPAGSFRPGNAQGLIPRMAPNNRVGTTVPSLVPGLIPGKGLTPGVGPPGLFRTNTVDSDRWQKVPPGQKGLIPSPQTPLPPVHKAENRYELGTVSNDEEVKQRQIKGILNKLTPQNFDKLFEQVKDVNIQSAITLTGVISQIFDKALTEPTFCEMYATFCKRLATDMPEFVEDGDKVTFKRVLLNKCQEEFQRGEREQAEASLMEGEGNDNMNAEREERRLKAKRRMLGNIRFIGELYKNHMLTERIMHECIRKLLGDYENPEEEDVEALCKLMSTIGYMIDQPMTKEHIDAYLERITRLSNNQKLSARIRFMLKDLIDLRRNGWQQRRKVEGPKRIEEVHRDAVQERQATVAQAGRLARGPSIIASSGRRLVPSDSGTRGPPSPMFSSTPTGITSSVRGAQTQGRTPLVQDVRMEDKLLMERSMPVPLSQRSVDEGPLTLGPQGGLGRGLSLRSQSSGSGIASVSEIRRFGPASMAAYSSNAPLGSERPVTPPERSTASGNLARSHHHLERTLSDKAPVAGNANLQQQGLGSRPSTAPAYVPLTEDLLIKKSEAALLEYFSAQDLKEAAQCVEDLQAPIFYPTMVSTWVALSFEKKDLDRELLAKLLISLQKSKEPLVKQEQILQGFQFVLDSLEDSVIDTPKAPDYTAKLLARMISAQALSLGQVGELLKKSEVFQSRFGLEILGKVLVGLSQDRGKRWLFETYQFSGVRLEEFLTTSKFESKSLSEFLEEYSLQCLGPEPDDEPSTNILQHVGAQLLEHFRRNEPVAETLRWLEKSADLQTQSESTFLQMLMTQVLAHLIPAESCEKDNRGDVVKEQLGQYRALLRKFATDKEKQRQYIIAMQLYVHDIGHPAGLMTTLFNTLYHEEVISESAFFKWQDDVNDSTAGRDKALRDVYRWLQWLKTESEQSQDDEF